MMRKFLKNIQRTNILIILLLTIASEYLIEYILFGHIFGHGYALRSVIAHILYYMFIPSLIIASELYNRHAKKSVQIFILVVPTLIHIAIHVVPFLHLTHRTHTDTLVPDMVQEIHHEEGGDDHTAIYEDEHEHSEDDHAHEHDHTDIDRMRYLVAIGLIALQVWLVESLLHRLPLNHSPKECDDHCTH